MMLSRDAVHDKALWAVTGKAVKDRGTPYHGANVRGSSGRARWRRRGPYDYHRRGR